MTEQEALNLMVPPGRVRPGKWRGGVIQVWVTRACDKSCFNCTQGSNLAGKPEMITVEQFEHALISLKGYFGVVGMFGGNPATHPQFTELCSLMCTHVPFRQRGLWCNNPMTADRAAVMRSTFNPDVSNLNVHLDRRAYELFREGWPESKPFGLEDDSRHSPPYVAMRDVVADEGERWGLISDCDINKHWSAMIGVFRGQLRAWFCEIAGAQAMLHQHEEGYPDTGTAPVDDRGDQWWRKPMGDFSEQVRKHCHDCGIPLRGYGELAQGGTTEQVSETHRGVYWPKRINRAVEVVTELVQLGVGRIGKVVDYIPNGRS